MAAFFVRHRGRGFLFYRASGPGDESLAEVYSVIALPAECDHQTLRMSGFAPPEDSHLLGVVPVGDLDLEYRGGEDLDEASLERALARLQKEAGAGSSPSGLLW